ncbi:hypothetical protein D5086_023124 [Populus alba]|uniref:Uncharacterized protein n=1 Tax=Populus alba TaxID=43335 RepID=A0ACC4B8V6_POPAL
MLLWLLGALKSPYAHHCLLSTAVFAIFAYKWVSRKSKGKMSPPEASSKEPNQTQSMFPLLYSPLFPVPA